MTTGKRTFLVVVLVLFSFCGIVCADELALRLEEKSIVVIIPSYNNKQWYKKNLDSVFSQSYQNYRVIFIDDASPDSTGLLAKSYIKMSGQEKRVTFIQNEKRVGALANIYHAAWLCDPTEIIVNLDGDDWLADEEVLSTLSRVYDDPDVWMTYGQFVMYPCGTMGWAEQVPSVVIENNLFRAYLWVTSHLRSYYAGLFQKINREDLLNEGEFFPMAGDLALMFPMLEMAGIHSRFVPDVLYIYNIATSNNDYKVDHSLQLHLTSVIRSKEKYKPLAELFIHKQLQESGICQEGALNLSQAKPAPKQLNLNKLGDAGGSQIQWLPTLAKTDF